MHGHTGHGRCPGRIRRVDSVAKDGFGFAGVQRGRRPSSLSGYAAIHVATSGPAAALRAIGGILMGVGLLRALEYPNQG